MKHGPRSAVTKLNGREVNGVEVDIIFAHELIQSHVLGVQPPLLPFGSIVGGDTWIANGRIELVRDRVRRKVSSNVAASLPKRLRREVSS